ncbi:MAG: 4-alpha-glucanotransferase [Saprospiraceae bacterium]
MKIHFHLHYATQFGENLIVKTEIRQGGKTITDEYPLTYLNETLWHSAVDLVAAHDAQLHYHYECRTANGQTRTEWGSRRVNFAEIKDTLDVYDYWTPMGTVQNAFETQAFRVLTPRETTSPTAKKTNRFTHTFRIKAPLLAAEHAVCLLGHGTALRAWDTKAPLLLQPDEQGWSIALDLAVENFPLGYKYGLWNTRTKEFLGFEDGSNRALYAAASPASTVILHDGFARFPLPAWRGAGVAIPVFSLRSASSFGVGEFTDLPALTDWAKSVGLRLIQLLPVNDTSATNTWVDSYPYSAVSAFALHPIYLNLAEVAGEKYQALLNPVTQKQQELNALDAVDYEAVLQVKWAIIRQLYAVQKTGFLKDPAFVRYFTENRHWLVPYAAFCLLRDQNGTTDFTAWPAHGVYQEKEIEQLVSPKSAHFDEVAVHYFVQWHLHRQLRAAVEYAHAQGLVLKGDIPIGIARQSCDAWVAPGLYDMGMQAGAPPDDFAVNGQNWGFPTYNWARMKADGFAWWRQRFEQMSLYFDAFRIDHILGFFRIWSIPAHAVEGILGHFVPAIPVTEREFREAGIGFNYERLCHPFINDAILHDFFGDRASSIRDTFLDRSPDGGHWSGGSQYVFKPAFDTQRKIEAYLATQPPPVVGKGSVSQKKTGSGAGKTVDQKTGENPLGKNKKGIPNPANEKVLEQAPLAPGREHVPNFNREDAGGLFALLANVILHDTTMQGAAERQYAFRIGMEKTASFRYLPDEVKEPMKAVYVNYFFRRQDDFWQREAMEKLPELKRATNMLICGEDLGMVPNCVPDVMQELGILSLEIQRMPKAAGATFFHPKDAPYLSVVTPSTHDMSTLRSWWEEDRASSQRFFNEVLGYAGTAPYYCEPWVCRALLAQHLHAPAMWAIFQLQDLLGMDGSLRRENPEDERINVPANPRHYWRYRMHMTLEALLGAEKFNGDLQKMVQDSGRS